MIFEFWSVSFIRVACLPMTLTNIKLSLACVKVACICALDQKIKFCFSNVSIGSEGGKTELHDVGVSQESCIEPHVGNTSSSDNCAQDTALCIRPTGKIVEIEALKVCEDGNSKNPLTAAPCDLAPDIDIQNSGLSRKRQKKVF